MRTKSARLTAQSATVEYHQGKPLLSFCSNDYLGLSSHPAVVKAFKDGVDRYGVGSGSAALVSGRCHAHAALEEEVADFLGRPSALLFSTGYMANLGVLSALLGREDVIFQDKRNHASLMDAALLSQAKHYRYPHGDTSALAQMLEKSPNKAGTTCIISDGIFSTDGRQASIDTLVGLADTHQATLMVDDAHGIGVLGSQGRGTLEHQGIAREKVPILVGTFGKALGTFGAFVSGNDTLIEALTQFARPYVYTTALPPALAEATRTSLRLLREEQWRREALWALIGVFRTQARALDLPLLDSQTPIQAIPIGEDKRAVEISDALIAQGFLVKAFRTPTVPKGQALLRVTLNATQTEAQINALLDVIAELGIAHT